MAKNVNVALLQIKSKFDEQSAKDAANQARKSFDKSFKDIGNINLSDEIVNQLNNAVQKINNNRLKKVNISEFSSELLDAFANSKDVDEITQAVEKFVNAINALDRAAKGNAGILDNLKYQQLKTVVGQVNALSELENNKDKEIASSKKEAEKIAKKSRSITDINQKYSKKDYSKQTKNILDRFSTDDKGQSLKFSSDQNKSIEKLSQLLGLYNDMKGIKPDIGSKENITYTKDLLTLVKEIKTTSEQIDLFSNGKASKLVNETVDKRYLDTILTDIDYSDILLRAINDYSKNNNSVVKIQNNIEQTEKDLNDYLAEWVQKSVDSAVAKAEGAVATAQKKSDKLQDKLGTSSNNNNQSNDGSIVGVDNVDLLILDEIEKRLNKINQSAIKGNASNKQLKEYIRLYKQYLELIESTPDKTVDNALQEEYNAILGYSLEFKQYADQLDNDRTKQLLEQKSQIKQTDITEEKLIETEKKANNVPQEEKKTTYTIDAEQALATIEQIKTGINEIPDEKNIKINVQNVDYNNVPLLSNEEGKVVTAFRGVTDAWSGLINDKNVAFFTDNLKLAADYADSLANDGKVYQANLSFHNPLEIDGNGSVWDKIEFNGVERTTEEIVEIAKQLGHDGVIFKNIRDGFGEANGEISNILVALNAAQIKNEKVIGTVKANTGEMVDVASKIDNATNTANKEVQLSVDGSKSFLEQEADLMQSIADNAQKAAEAKKEFAEANSKVSDSAKETTEQLEIEANKISEVKKQANTSIQEKKFDISADVFSEMKENPLSYFSKVYNSVDKMSDTIKAKFGKQGFTDIEVSGIETLDKKIEHLTVTAKDASGVLKTFEYDRKRIEGQKNAFLIANENVKVNTATETKTNSSNIVVDIEGIDGNTDALTKNTEALNKNTSELHNGVHLSKSDIDLLNKSGKSSNSQDGSGTSNDSKPVNDKENSNIAKEKRKLRQNEKQSEQSAVNKALKDQLTAWQKIQSIREKIEKSNSPEEIAVLQEVKKYYQEQYISANKILKAHSDLYDKESQTLKLEQIRLETNAKIAKYKNSESNKADKRQVKVDSMISGLGKYEGNLKNYQNRIDSGSANEPFIKKFNDYFTAYTNYAAAIKNAQNLRENNKLVPDEEINNLEKLKTALDEAEQSIKSLSKVDVGSSSISRNKLIVQMNDYLKKNSGMSKEFKAELNGIIAQVKELGASADVSNFANQFLDLKVRIHDAGQEGKSFLDIIKNKAMYGLAAQIGMYFGINDIIRYIREGISVVGEYDDALSKISYTMDVTKSQLDDLGSSVLDLASDMKASISDAMQVAQIYANMNTTAEEIQKLSQPTLILSNLTGFDAETVANDIQAVNQQFEIAAEDAMQIADIYDYISRNVAVDYSKGIEGMASGIQIVGSTAKQAGLDFAQTASVIAKAMEKTRLDGDQIANGLKTKNCLYVQKCA